MQMGAEVRRQVKTSPEGRVSAIRPSGRLAQATCPRQRSSFLFIIY
jgi:hypothetical protein